MNLKPYAVALAATEDQKTKDLAPVRAVQSQKEVEVRIARIDIEIMQQEQALAAYASQFPLPIDSIVNSLDCIALKKRQREQLQSVAEQLFPPAPPAVVTK